MTRTRVIIYEPYPFSMVSGNLRTLTYILQFLDRDRFEPIVVVPFATGLVARIEQQLDGACHVIEPDERLKRYGGQALADGLLGRIATLAAVVRYGIKVARFARQQRADVIYCNGIRAVITVGIMCRCFGIPILWYVKGQLEQRTLDTVGYITANRILFQSESNSRDSYPLLRRLFDYKVGILPTGLDVAEIDNMGVEQHLGVELGVTSSNVNVIYMGQLYGPKGVHFLIEAFAQACDEFPGMKLYVVGDPIVDEYRAYLDELDTIVEQHGIQEKVVFTGWRDDALQIMSLMDIVVHPSLAEGFARAVLEGMTLGKPVVATGVGGERETIEHGVNGFLVEKGHSEPIREALLKLCRDPELRASVGAKAAETIRKKHDIRDKIQQIGDEFNALAKPGPESAA